MLIESFAAEVEAHHDHAGVPEKQDVVAADEQARGVIGAEIGRVVGPAERGERPEAGAEPGVEDVGVLREFRAAAFRAFRGHACGAGVAVDDFDARIERGDHFLAVGAMPDGDAMAPPELARDAPVANIVEPVEQDGALIIGDDFDQPVEDGFFRGLGERLHFHEPLRGDARLD